MFPCSLVCADTGVAVATAFEGASTPHLATTPTGAVVLSWVKRDEEKASLRYAVLGAGGWSEPATVSSGSDWFLNWADFPSVEPINASLWAAQWLRKRPGGKYAYDVVVSLSQDAGDTWSAPFTPHHDNTRTEHGFVSLFPMGNEAGALWLDGRNTSGAPHDHNDHGKTGGMTLRAAALNVDGSTSHDALVDDLTCDCCRTDVVTTPDGPLVVFRNRTKDETRDIYTSRLIDGKWTSPVPVFDDGWIINGCPVNGPAASARGDHVAVAWFTGANDRPLIRLALSSDRGVTFERPLLLDNDAPIGRVDVAHMADGEVVVTWLARAHDGKAPIRLARVAADGAIAEQATVAYASPLRRSGLPRLAPLGTGVIVAWTDVSGESSRVRAEFWP